MRIAEMGGSMRIVAVIQARMSSSRYPGKMLAPLCEAPMILYQCRRIARCRDLDGMVVATSDGPDDTPLADVVAAAGYAVFRGGLDDVLGRVLAAARAHRADAIVRLTGDCPLIDPDVIDAMVRRFREHRLAYLSNTSPPSFPEGLDCEVITVDALEYADREAKDAHDREHVTAFVRERPDRFPSGNFEYTGRDLSDIHWSVNHPEDLSLLQDVLTAVGVPDPRLDDLIRVLDTRPDIAARSREGSPNENGIRSFLLALDRRTPRPVTEQSDAWWRRANGLIPAGTQTLSKGPTQFVCGFAPKYLARGKGSHVWDVDGNEFIDYPMGLGSVTLGHGHPEVAAAVAQQIASGTAFTLMHPLEVQVAERIRAVVPCADMVRFGKNGSDATTACIRAARAKTGRTRILRCGYHGWQDWSVDSSYGIRARGVPTEVMTLTTPFPYNDLEALQRLLQAEAYAAVIMEPMTIEPPGEGYLRGVRQLATRYGAVLIFDEIVTGFRYARGGAQEYFGVTPDLTAMGKGVANGLPLSIVCGKREYMEVFEEVFFSFTFGGETASLAAALATLDIMERENYWSHVWRLGARLQEGHRALVREFHLENVTDCRGLPPWTVVTFNDTPRWSGLQLKSLFQQEMLRHRILFSGSQLVSLSHSDDDVAKTLDAYREAMRVMRVALDLHAVDTMTLGLPIQPVFRRV